MGAAGAGRLGAPVGVWQENGSSRGLRTGQRAPVLRPALHHPRSRPSWLSLGPGSSGLLHKAGRGRGNSGARTLTWPSADTLDWLPEGGRHQVSLGLPEVDRPPGSGSTENLVTPACPGPHLLALLLCEAGQRACEMKLSVLLRFPWVLHLLGKTSDLFKAYSRFSQVSFYCSMVDCFLVVFFFFFCARLCASYLTTL